MQELWLIFSFVLAFLVAFLSTPLVKGFAHRIGAVDLPDESRRVHKRPTPRLGGVAIFYGFIVSVLIFCNITTEIRGIIIGALIIIGLGVFDDTKHLRASVKLVIQILAALVVVFHGVSIDVWTVPSFINESGMIVFGIFSIPVTIIWIVAITNAVNLIDGLDGLAVGVSSICSMALLCIALMFSEYNIALITAALAGACFGFLPYNFNPAKIFMGDTGALFLGFILSTVSILGLFKSYAVISFAVPLLILGLPIFDTGITILRRIKNKKPIMEADRGHLHHRLLDMGFSQKQVVAILYILCSMFCLTAIVLIGNGELRAMAVILAVIAAVVISVRYFDIPTEEKSEAQDEEEIPPPS